MGEKLNPEDRDKQLTATVAALVGIGPKDELEGMISAQMVAAHIATMECYRRAMLGEQTFEGRRENLVQANKLSRTYATLLEALNRHRGKGQQKVTVEHVNLHAGGQAVVGNVNAPTPHEGGVHGKAEDQPHALGHAPGVEMPSQIERSGLKCRAPAARGHNVCRMHGAAGGAPKDNQNARRHGLFGWEAVETRRMSRPSTLRARQRRFQQPFL